MRTSSDELVGISSLPKPVLKWAGGKSRLPEYLLPKISKDYNTKSWILIILGIITMESFAIAGNPESTKLHKAKIQIMLFEEQLSEFHSDVGRYPTMKEGLNALVICPSDAPNCKGHYSPKMINRRDPWGNQYRYIFPPQYGHKDFDLYSFGANGTDDSGEKDDISNWCEVNQEYYGGLSNKDMIMMYLISFVIAASAILGVIKKKNPSLSDISIRFGIYSFFSLMAMLIIPAIGSDELSFFSMIIFCSISFCFIGFPIMGIIFSFYFIRNFELKYERREQCSKSQQF